MKTNLLPNWYLCAWLAACLSVAGCSGNPPQLSLAASETPAVQARPVAPPPIVVVETPVPPPEPPPVVEVPPVKALPASALTWDATEQRRVVKEGEGPVLFRFQMKNVSPQPVVIEKVNVSCGCTTVETREMPFTLAPGASEDLQVSMSLAGKFGTVTKSLLVQGSQATWTLLVTSEITPPSDEVLVPDVPNGAGMSAGVRGKNIGLAMADRQAVFKGDCARCHTQPAERQLGYGLYLGACAICHDAEHRASMVPDLRVADESHDAAYWRENITDGVDGTLMPAFAKTHGGILSDEQIESLVKFLVETPLEAKAPFR